MKSSAKQIAFGGVFAALAIVIMSMGGLIPVATYVCPIIGTVILQIVLTSCGTRIAWVWYVTVALLTSLLCPDKEAAAVFVFFGYYPIFKPRIDKLRIKHLLKLLLFNGASLLMYFLLIRLFGMDDLREEFSQMGEWMLIVTLLLGNLTFALLDRLLARFNLKKGR